MQFSKTPRYMSTSERYVTIAPRVPLTELSLRVGCVSNLRSTLVFNMFKKIAS